MAATATTIGSMLSRLMPLRRPSRSTLLWAAYFAVLFAVFLVVTFPHDVVARRVAERISQETGWSLRYENVSLSPLDGYRFRDLSLTPPASLEPAFEAGRFALRPTLGALFRANVFPAVFRGETYGGSFRGTYDNAGESSLALEWTDVDLARMGAVARAVEGTWSGRFSGELALRGRGPLAALDGSGKLLLRDGAILKGRLSGFAIPDLHVAQGESQFKLEKGRLEIERLRLAGPEVEVEVRGQVTLRTPAEQSAIALNASVKPIPGSPAGQSIEGLLLLANRNQRPPNGVYAYKLGGTLARPRVQ